MGCSGCVFLQQLILGWIPGQQPCPPLSVLGSDAAAPTSEGSSGVSPPSIVPSELPAPQSLRSELPGL